ncbi:MAG: fumarylacetoacetate hydrolase family protein [Negativicutes bacterium]|nr:fumarylacetoacetate hydrolase family protein [Negativicutes bacterium]
MKFVTYEQYGEQYAGLLTGGEKFILPLAAAEKRFFGTSSLPATLMGIIAAGENAVARIEQLKTRVKAEPSFPLIAADSVKLLAPIPRPAKNIFCIGKNYVEHAFEFDKTRNPDSVPKFPVVFTKPPTAVTGPDSIVLNHAHATSALDYEVELVVVIGKTGFNIPKEQAFEHVFGYTIMNDVTARDLQKRHMQWFLGKGPDTFAPMGPCLVHKSALPKPDTLDIKCSINGELRQNANTKDMIFDIPTLIATLSAMITLEPGDLIATGTPSGVGGGFTPPKFLKSGDVMELEVSGIGVLRNTIQ